MVTAFKRVHEKLEEALGDWAMMGKTDGDEGEDTAERFEKNFYEFVELFEHAFHTLSPAPESMEEAEQLDEIKIIQQKLPVPLQLNFELELERVIDGEKDQRFD